MTHLLAISIGPVQECIAAARRTRDLWFGSYLLSEISRAVAQSVESQGGRLIFPATSNADNVANVILAELTDHNPKEVAAQAKLVAQTRWKEFAESARGEVSGIIRQDIWDGQVNDVIECYAAWVLQTDPKQYPEDRARVMRLLAGRKNCRDFLPAQGKAGIPKSSLDGQRETVLIEGDRTSWPKKLRLAAGEQLDVIGVTKRVGTNVDGSIPRYPSVARVAADPWLRGVAAQGALDGLKTACEKLVAEGVHTVHEAHYQDFPYEGTVIYRNRHPDLIEELGLTKSDLDEVAEALDALGEDPNPYLAVLVADGDHMGKTIAALSSPDAHRTFSHALAGFAEQARTIVHDHRGVLVYAGGDDVLAFLPVDQCLKCARRLHDRFGELLNAYGSLTLSVGIAIGHFMENLEDLLNYGRAAEKHAKQPKSEDGGHQRARDGLAVHVYKRGGSPVTVRANWSDNLDARLLRLAQWITDRAISSRVAYDLQTIATVYDNWPDGQVQDAIQRDTIAVLKQKQPRGESRMTEIANMIRSRVRDAASLRHVSDELLIARFIAQVMGQASGHVMAEEVSP